MLSVYGERAGASLRPRDGLERAGEIGEAGIVFSGCGCAGAVVRQAGGGRLEPEVLRPAGGRRRADSGSGSPWSWPASSCGG